MPKKQLPSKAILPMALVKDFQHATLRIEDGWYELTGNLRQVSLRDREEIAAIVAKAVDLTHDEAYVMVWSSWGKPL